ncbi:EAL domain-containing protein [Lyngbya aestuarii]|uniref:EAL domain-containing protein n=1 Tax=Lyngbya aestuarii TaxID=118322 RepID=UPI00403E2BE8
MIDKLANQKNLAGKVLFIYGGFGSLWILFSDWLLRFLSNDTKLFTQLQTFKGLAFVLLTSGLFYRILKQEEQSQQASYSILFTESNQLLEELQQEKEDLAALSSVTANSVSTLNLEELLNVLLQRILEVMHADAGVILLKKDNRLEVRACIGIEQQTCPAYAVAIGEGFAGRIAATMQSLYIEDAQADCSVVGQLTKESGIRTMLGVPLERNSNLVGVLYLDWLSIHPPSDRELNLLEITAERCTMAILNAQLYEETKHLQERLQLQVDQMPIGCIINDGQLRLKDWNPAAEKIFGFTKEEVLGKNPCDLIVSPQLRSHIENIYQQLATGETTVHSINENLTKDGRVIICDWYSTPLKATDNSVVGTLSMVQDVTERQQTEEKVRRYAFHEPLTGLPNRAWFLERLEQLIVGRKNRQSGLFAVLFLELERFEMVKYSLGHAAADQLMIATAKRLEACLQPDDTLARLGSAELAILLADIQDREEVTKIADHLDQQLMLPFDFEGCEVFSSSSMGIVLCTSQQSASDQEWQPCPVESCPEASYPPSSARLWPSLTCGKLPEDLLRAADTARHHAKLHGLKPYAVFHPAMHEQVVARFQLETDLRRALERQEFQVYYQPIVSLKTGKISGFEALVRWNHPTRGMVSPTEFIPVAEETGMVNLIDWWVIGEACTQLGIWQQRFAAEVPLTMSMNLSGLQLTQLSLLERLDKILRQTSIEGRTLKLEITETGLLKNVNSSTAMLKQLKTLGIQLSIDDFGTGYSSLERLHQLPIDTLKIDRSFVNRLGFQDNSLEVIRTIITLAHRLQMDVIAEGVETTLQLSQLRTLDCEYGQGYFFSRPLDSYAAGELLAAEWQW